MEKMFWGYALNHMGSTYCILNICKKCVALSRDAICLNNTYVEYVSRFQYTKAVDYVLHNEDDSNKRARIKMYPIKTDSVKTENYYRGGKRYQRQ